MQIVGAARAAAGVAGETEQRGKVNGRALLDLEQVGAAHELFDGARAQPRHDLAQLRGDEAHEAFHVFRLADEALAQLWVLRGDAEGDRSPGGRRASCGSPERRAARWRSQIPPRPAAGRRRHRDRSSACRPSPASRTGAGRCGTAPDGPRPARSPTADPRGECCSSARPRCRPRRRR